MPKLFAGFLLGVFSSLAVVLLLDRSPGDDPEGDLGQSIATESGVDTLSRKASHDTGEESVGEDGRIATTPAADADLSANLPVSFPEATATATQTSLPVQPGSGSGLPEGAQGNDYPPEIAEMIDKRVDKELQARYEGDPREDSWAAYLEGQLSAYFAQKPVLSQFYFSLIDCRTSVCSVHALGYGPDALTQWNTATADLVSQPWFEFNSMSMNRRNPEPDVLAIVLILNKKPPE